MLSLEKFQGKASFFILSEVLCFHENFKMKWHDLVNDLEWKILKQIWLKQN